MYQPKEAFELLLGEQMYQPKEAFELLLGEQMYQPKEAFELLFGRTDVPTKRFPLEPLAA